MKKPLKDRRAQSNTASRRTSGAQMAHRYSAGSNLEALQQQADHSTAHQNLTAIKHKTVGTLQREGAEKSGAPDWAQEEYRNKVGKKGQVDTRSGPRMPDYGANEVPSWKKNDRVDVPDWAKREYKADAKVTLMASVKDGKIGSIYFNNGRIRTTHAGGPTKSLHHAGIRNQKFNLDYDAAWRLFLQKNRGIYAIFYELTNPAQTPKERQSETYRYLFKQCDEWLSVFLNLTPVDQLPAWVTPVMGPDDAFDTAATDPPDDITLFEVFTTVSNGKVDHWHPSRGIAAKFETNKQVVSVLKTALAHIKDITDTGQRNRAFYEFISRRIPSLADQIRHPDEI
ncbi:MAG: hypothetical protein AB8B62_12355 [Roseobacter sp.]